MESGGHVRAAALGRWPAPSPTLPIPNPGSPRLSPGPTNPARLAYKP